MKNYSTNEEISFLKVIEDSFDESGEAKTTALVENAKKRNISNSELYYGIEALNEKGYIRLKEFDTSRRKGEPSVLFITISTITDSGIELLKQD